MSEEEEEVIRLLQRDVLGTTGVGWERMIRDAASSIRHLFNENADIADDEGNDDPGWATKDYVERVVEDVQQTMHDLFADTSWPRCPKHPHHPLWFKEGSWTCTSDNVRIAKLGELSDQSAE